MEIFKSFFYFIFSFLFSSESSSQIISEPAVVRSQDKKTKWQSTIE